MRVCSGSSYYILCSRNTWFLLPPSRLNLNFHGVAVVFQVFMQNRGSNKSICVILEISFEVMANEIRPFGQRQQPVYNIRYVMCYPKPHPGATWAPGLLSVQSSDFFDLNCSWTERARWEFFKGDNFLERMTQSHALRARSNCLHQLFKQML